MRSLWHLSRHLTARADDNHAAPPRLPCGCTVSGTFRRIASIHGISMEELITLNNIKNYTIHPGQTLRIKYAVSLNSNDIVVLGPNDDIEAWILYSKKKLKGQAKGKVDLGRFKDKHGNTPLNKNSGTFKDGRQTIEKDTAQHGGRRWKLKQDGHRIGSLDKDGNIIAD